MRASKSVKQQLKMDFPLQNRER